MLKKYTSEQFWKLYEKLPQELKDALFADETGNNIYEVCQRNEIGENLEDIVDLVGQVLAGVLAPDDFQGILEKELKLEKETAKKTAQEINRFIFYPVRTELEKLYQTKVTAPVVEVRLQQKPQPTATGPKKDDTYREPVE
ncbi:MAG: hypothetical protein AAB451_02445 [Patescibacteria group bacterium]